MDDETNTDQTSGDGSDEGAGSQYEAARRSLSAADRWQPGGAPPPADAPGEHGLELRVAGRGGAPAAEAAVRIRGRLAGALWRF
jgi:hypothetical protein